MKKLWCVKKILLYAVALVVVGDMRASQRGQSWVNVLLCGNDPCFISKPV